MADISSYKKDIQEAANGNRAKAYVVDALNAINLDGPSATTFYGLQQDAYVKRAIKVVHYYDDQGTIVSSSALDATPDTLDARKTALIQKIKKIDMPADAIWVDDPTLLKLYSDMILNTKGFRKIIGNLGAYPKQ